MGAEQELSPELLSVHDLSVAIGRPRVQAVDGISFSIRQGEVLGLAGESGSGKSMTALALTRLLPATAAPVCQGEVLLAGDPANLLRLGERSLRAIRGKRIGYLFQEPSSSFNPLFTIGQHLQEILRINRIPSKDRQQLILGALAEVGIPTDRQHLDAYPADFSGGMLQRVALACALIPSPSLLVADEPTTALDVSTQKRVVELLLALKQSRNMSILFITHDLGLLKQLASRVLIMHQGKIVESGPVTDVLTQPQHPYTRNLVDSLPKLRL